MKRKLIAFVLLVTMAINVSAQTVTGGRGSWDYFITFALHLGLSPAAAIMYALSQMKAAVSYDSRNQEGPSNQTIQEVQE